MTGRSSGILLPIFSLPGGCGVGSLGGGRPNLCRLSCRSGTALVADSPLVPPGSGNSPYMSPSAFAGNPWFLDLEDLARDGLLTPTSSGRPDIPIWTGWTIGGWPKPASPCCAGLGSEEGRPAGRSRTPFCGRRPAGCPTTLCSPPCTPTWALCLWTGGRSPSAAGTRRRWSRTEPGWPTRSTSRCFCSISSSASGPPCGPTPGPEESPSWATCPSTSQPTARRGGPSPGASSATRRAAPRRLPACPPTPSPTWASTGATPSMTGPDTGRRSLPGGCAGWNTPRCSTTRCASPTSGASTPTGPTPLGPPPPWRAAGSPVPARTWWTTCVGRSPAWT
jgi:hypothetical protein